VNANTKSHTGPPKPVCIDIT